MEVVFTRRYKINLFFSLAISLIAATFASYASPYLLKDVFSSVESYQGGIAAVVFVVFHLSLTSKYRKRKKIASAPFPAEWRDILSELVIFYRMLNADDKYIFEKKVQIFLGEKRITGIETDIDSATKILIASAAVIPVFRIEDWEYDTLGEILVYPDRFNHEYSFTPGDDDRDVLGMVMQHSSTLIISKKELFRGFNIRDGGNTAIHEFIHKIDEEDGEIDGLPVLMLNSMEILEWKRVRELEIEKIKSGRSDISNYALTGPAEFLAVTGEYFFDYPEKLKNNNPELYNILKIIFKQDTAKLLKSEAKRLFRLKKK